MSGRGLSNVMYNILLFFFCISCVQVCAANGSSSYASYKSNLLDDIVREKILVSASQTSQ